MTGKGRVMGWYDRHVMPRVVEFACTQKPNMRQRAKVVPQARGRVLELGFGSGLNLPFYRPDRVQRVWALDPCDELWHLAGRAVAASPVPVERLAAGAEAVPLPDASVDTVLVTFSLCTIPDVHSALREAARVLAPDGQLVFCEHGEAPDASVRRWQKRLNPMWKRLGGGCHLDRPIPRLIEQAGWRIRNLSSGYLPGWRPASYNYWGVAAPARK